MTVMQKCVALRPFRYAQKSIEPGDVFEATPKDAYALRLVKRVKYHDDEPLPEPKEPIETRSLQATDGGDGGEQESTAPRPKQRYLRRDLRAED